MGSLLGDRVAVFKYVKGLSLKDRAELFRMIPENRIKNSRFNQSGHQEEF